MIVSFLPLKRGGFLERGELISYYLTGVYLFVEGRGSRVSCRGRGYHVEGRGSRVTFFFQFFFGKGNNRCNQCH